MKPKKQRGDDSPTAAGAFLSDGSWSETAELRHRGHIHALVTALCRQRRDGRLGLQLAAHAIEAANAQVAFPNFREWAEREHWALAPTSTSAEEAVKREGRGEKGHWCGQRWMPGSASDCQEIRHRAVACPPESKAALEAMFGSFDVRDLGVDQPPPMQ